MKRFLKYSIPAVALLLSSTAWTQQSITLKSAIDTALQNNFDIQIAKNNQEIGRTNNTFGVAGGLPTVNINGTDNLSHYNLDQTLSNGSELKNPNVKSNVINASAMASMTLFNGFKVLATKAKLNQLQKQSEIMVNQQIQNTMAGVMVAYWDIIRQQYYHNIIQSSLDVSTQKLDIIKARNAVGMANDADILQAEMDVNMATQLLANQQVLIEADKTNLLQLMGTKNFYLFDVKDSIILDKTIQKDSILSLIETNPQYQSAQEQVFINQQIAKELGAQRYPSLKVGAGYTFAYTDNSAGNILLNQTYGPTVGATLQIPVFNGTIYQKQQKVAHINVKSAELQKESVMVSLKASVERSFQSYQNALNQLVAQQEAYQKAIKLVSLVVHRFELNQATILDVKAAQNSLESAGYMLVNLNYSAKISEIELKRLVYRLSY